MQLRISGNTFNPALSVLKAKGYRLVVDSPETEDGLNDWQAEKNGDRYSATNPVELLGLVVIGEQFGEGWQNAIFTPDILGEILSD